MAGSMSIVARKMYRLSVISAIISLQHDIVTEGAVHDLRVTSDYLLLRSEYNVNAQDDPAESFASATRTERGALYDSLHVTACSMAFCNTALLQISQLRAVLGSKVPIHVWVWPDVDHEMLQAISSWGAVVHKLPIEFEPWPGFWSPLLYAWKLFVVARSLQVARRVLYLDSGISAVRSLDDVWDQIETQGYYLIHNDTPHTNGKW